MRMITAILLMTSLLALASVGRLPMTTNDGAVNVAAAAKRDLGREALPENDGWASIDGGTTGGLRAAPEHVYTVTNRSELVAALGIGDVPKIIYVQGAIEANVDDNNQPLTCEDYAVEPYTLEAYLEAYDPATWGRDEPSGPLEDARRASQRAQRARIRINVPSNTTIVGLGDDARIVGANVWLRDVDNIIIRNITFQDAYDCFPEWDPTDGDTGDWNAQYDNITLRGATHVWIDHNTLNDGAHPDSEQPVYFGQRYQVHDGLVDITNGSDLVTVSWNRFSGHDKTMLIGSSDRSTQDFGKLRVTLHHNLFADVGQRAPRVRFGQVHVYNNFYDISSAAGYGYSWGVGVESKIYAENNYFRSPEVSADEFISRFKGTAIHVAGTLVNGHSAADAVDVLAAYNAENDPDLSADVGWTPTLYSVFHPTQAVPALVESRAGPFPAE